LLIPFSLLWGVFAILWNLIVWTNGAPVFFRLWGLPFLLVGLYVTVGRFAVEAFLRRRIVYALTDRRVLILRRAPFERLRSFEIGHLPFLEYEEQRGGRGTIRFDDDRPSNPWLAGRNDVWLPRTRAACFEGIADSRRVYELIVRETDRWRRERYGDDASRSFIG